MPKNQEGNFRQELLRRPKTPGKMPRNTLDTLRNLSRAAGASASLKRRRIKGGRKPNPLRDGSTILE